MNRWKIGFELLAGLVHGAAGAFVGFVFSIGENGETRLAWILVTAVMLILAWVVARLYGQSFFWEIGNVVQGMFVGAVFGLGNGLIAALTGNVLIGSAVDWLLFLGMFVLIGGVYGWIGGRRRRTSKR